MKITTAQPSAIEAIVRSDVNTKRLLRTIRPGEIALIRHADLDEAAAEALCSARVKAVVNSASTMTGLFPHDGPVSLLKSGIPIYEIDEMYFNEFRSGSVVRIEDGFVVCGSLSAPCLRFTYERLKAAGRIGQRNYTESLLSFIDNTLHYAGKELETLMIPLSVPPLHKPFKGRTAVVVARGPGDREDLAAIRDFIAEEKPVLIGVDGGADVLAAQGCRADYIVGDMDSVSDKALRDGAQLLVHAYPDGRAPGLRRLNGLGLTAGILAAPGTSEDAAVRLAFEQEADCIILVGSHQHPIEFMKKGRSGMGSTLLLRMLVGSKLIDVKGASRWMRSGRKPLLTVVAGTPAAAEGGKGG